MIAIGATGLVCSVGLSAKAACAAMRAGIAGFNELPYWDKRAAPIVGASVPTLDFELQFGPRLVQLAALALQDCLAGMPPLPLVEIPLLVGLAEPGRPGGGAGFAETIVSRIQNKLSLRFHPRLSATVVQGHTSGFECLRRARELVRTSDVTGCLVCGVDSYINASSLAWLDDHWRLKREEHTDGVIPGEAAAAVFLQRADGAKATPTPEVTGLGFGYEKAGILSEEPLRGTGLADAGRQALAEAGWQFHEMEFRLSDVTGEDYGFREHALAHARLMRVVRLQDHPLWHPADSIGDTGAAAGVVQLVLAAAAWVKGYGPGDRAMCFTSAVPGERAAAVLQVRKR